MYNYWGVSQSVRQVAKQATQSIAGGKSFKKVSPATIDIHSTATSVDSPPFTIHLSLPVLFLVVLILSSGQMVLAWIGIGDWRVAGTVAHHRRPSPSRVKMAGLRAPGH